MSVLIVLSTYIYFLRFGFILQADLIKKAFKIHPEKGAQMIWQKRVNIFFPDKID